MNKKEFANRLNEVYRHLYANHGISSQKEFAEAIKVQRSAVSAALNGNALYLTKNLFMGQLAVSIFGLSGADEWVTNVAIMATDSNDDVIGSANIVGAPFKANRSTDYSGSLFGSSGTMDVSLNGSWENPKTGNW